jgi:hypothetical protein
MIDFRNWQKPGVVGRLVVDLLERLGCGLTDELALDARWLRIARVDPE